MFLVRFEVLEVPAEDHQETLYQNIGRKKGKNGRNTVGKDVKEWTGEGKDKNCLLCVFTDDKLITYYQTCLLQLERVYTLVSITEFFPNHGRLGVQRKNLFPFSRREFTTYVHEASGDMFITVKYGGKACIFCLESCVMNCYRLRQLETQVKLFLIDNCVLEYSRSLMPGNDKYVGFLAGCTERGLEIAGRSRVISMNYLSMHSIYCRKDSQNSFTN